MRRRMMPAFWLAAVLGVVVGAMVVFPESGRATQETFLVFSAPNDEGGYSIFRIRSDGTDLTLIVDGGHEPTASPDGEWIAFRGFGGFTPDLWKVRLDGTDAQQLTTGIAEVINPAWSPDGTRVAFSARFETPGSQIYLVGADGSGPQRVSTRDDDFHVSPAWSPDGTRIAYASQLATENPPNGPSDIDVYVSDLDGQNEINVTNDIVPTYFDRDPAWSPDGASLAFSRSTPTLGGSIWTVELSSLSETRLTPSGFGAGDSEPAWSPDGEALAIIRDGGLTVISDTGAFVRQMGPANASSPAWFAVEVIPDVSFQFSGPEGLGLEWTGTGDAWVHRSDPAGAASVLCVSSAGSALPDIDYSSAAVSAHFSDGQSYAPCSIDVSDDLEAEEFEDFTLTLEPNGAGHLGTQTTIWMRIVDDDGFGDVSVSVSSTEVTENVGSVQLQVNRTGNLTGGIVVRISLVEGTASSADFSGGGSDFFLHDGVAGTSASIPILADGIPEGPESFFIQIQPPLGNWTLVTAPEIEVRIEDGGPPSPATITALQLPMPGIGAPGIVFGSGFLPGAFVQFTTVGANFIFSGFPGIPNQLIFNFGGQVVPPGDYEVRVFNPGTPESNVWPITIVPPPPLTITSLSPAPIPANLSGSPITITGTGFEPGILMEVDLPGGTFTFNPSFMSPEQLQFYFEWIFPTPEPGSYEFRLRNPSGALSEPAILEVAPPVTATILTVTPSVGPANDLGEILVITGTGLSVASYVEVRREGFTNTFGLQRISDTEVHAFVDPWSFPENPAGTYELRVVNNGGFASNALDLTVLPPLVPVIDSISANSAVALEPLVLDVFGSNFVGITYVRLHDPETGFELANSPINEDDEHLIFDLPGSSLYAAGNFELTIVSYGPGNIQSNSVPFTILPAAPAPVVDSVVPSTITLEGPTGSSQTTEFVEITVTGSGFTEGTFIPWTPSNSICGWSYQSETEMRVTLCLDSAGTKTLHFYNQGSGPSEPVTVEVLPPSASETFVVTTLHNGPDDGICDFFCTLSEAIDSANAHPNATGTADRIEIGLAPSQPGTMIFNVDPSQGWPDLPAITEGVELDATMIPGASCEPRRLRFEIRGSQSASPFGLVVQGHGTTIRGIAVTGFGSGGSGAGIMLQGAEHVVECSDIGVSSWHIDDDNQGSQANGNGTGISLSGASNVRIGSDDFAMRNIISGNGSGVCSAGGGAGVFINGASSENVVIGNYFGVDRYGTTPISSFLGVQVLGSGNFVGEGGAGNVFGYHTSMAVGIFGGSGNVVAGNSMFENCRGISAGGNGTQVLDNVINDNAEYGVLNSGGATISGNRIYRNGGLGIHGAGSGFTFARPGLFGLSEPDDSNTAQVTARMPGVGPGTSVRFEFFANQSCDPSGAGEGELPLGGSIEVVADPLGVATATTTVMPLLPGWVLTATATRLDSGITTQFSECRLPGFELDAVNPAILRGGGPDTEFTVEGSGFLPGVKARVSGGFILPVTLDSPNQARVVVPAVILSTAGPKNIQFFYDSGVIASTPALTFTVLPNPTPTISSLTPVSLTAAAAPGAVVELDVSGFLGFGQTTFTVSNGGSFANPVITGSGENVHVSFVPFPIESGQTMVTPGTYEIRATNPGPGGGASNVLLLFVTETPAAVTDVVVETAVEPEVISVAVDSPEEGVPPVVEATTGVGTGTVAVAAYEGNPGSIPAFAVSGDPGDPDSGTYVDVYVSPESNFETATIVICDPNGGDTAYWLEGTEWQPIAPEHSEYDPVTGCITITVDSESDPSIADLSGTVFATARGYAPVITSVVPEAGVVPLGTQVSVAAAFTDVDLPGDTHAWLVDWGDGTTSAQLAHTYASPGVYRLTLTVIDSDGASDQEVYTYIVVYDASAGFVTGGGWFTSPPGAYAPGPLLTGKATFGFVSRYRQGAHTPTGNTEFQFNAAGLNFVSTSYEWLVISGLKAQFRGSGTINGQGQYDFSLSAIDSLSGDSFRIRIWDRQGGGLVYDNQVNSPEDAEPSTQLGGGSIVIHK